VKYADGPSVEVDVLIDAPIERVWEVVTDIELPTRFSSELQSVEWLDDGPAPGARFVGNNHHDALGDWQTTCWVDRFEPPHRFSWLVSDPDDPSASWWFELEAEEDGVRVRQGGRLGPARSGLTYAITAMPDKEDRIVARRLEEWERNMRANLDGIKQLAETET
jgi:uncharacterized protein YndB with AHSA1/START domain